MIKAIAIVSAAVVLATGCSGQEPSAPEDAKVKALTAKLAPAIRCEPSHASKIDQSMRAECDGGGVFVTAYPDAAGLRTELARLATMAVPPGDDYLVGDTWFAGSIRPDGLNELRMFLGGRVQHVGASTPAG